MNPRSPLGLTVLKFVAFGVLGVGADLAAYWAIRYDLLGTQPWWGMLLIPAVICFGVPTALFVLFAPMAGMILLAQKLGFDWSEGGGW